MVRSSAIGSGRVGHAVIVEKIVAAVDAVGQCRDIGAHERLGARAQDCERLGDGLLAVLVEQRIEPPLAEIERVELSV